MIELVRLYMLYLYLPIIWITPTIIISLLSVYYIHTSYLYGLFFKHFQ